MGIAVVICVAALLASRDVSGDNPGELDASRAFGYLSSICELGPRISGSEAMDRQRRLLEKHFSEMGGVVSKQEFDTSHPESGLPVRMCNLIVAWQPELKNRVLVACHYDTRPLADRDPDEKKRMLPFSGANDGASGVAALMELGHHMKGRKTPLGVDFVFFDGEELIYKPGDRYFIGSRHFSQDYLDHPPQHKYVAGLLLDMIGDKDLQIFIEKISQESAPDVTASVFKVAADLGIKEFVSEPKHEVPDDHLTLNKRAKIPTCSLIDFDYPHWHTTSDVPAACSGDSLAKVGRVVLRWLDTYGNAETNPEGHVQRTIEP